MILAFPHHRGRTTVTLTADDVDIAAKDFWARPWAEREEAFKALRRGNPVSWSRPAESDLLPPEQNTRGFWSLTKYDDIRYASRHPEIFSSSGGVIMEDFPPEVTEMAQSFIAMDAPRHTALRGITLGAFTPANMRRLDGWIMGHAKDLISEMSHLGQGDFVDLVSVQLPGRIFGEFFGLERGSELHTRAVNAAQRVLAWTDPEVCGDLTPLQLFAGSAQELHDVIAELIPQRRANPGEDLVSWIANAEFEGVQMTDFEIGSFFVLLAVAANDTTRHASAQAIHAFTQNPDQRALLVEDIPGRVDGAVEEIVRWASPLIHMRRTAAVDVELRGSEIKAGEKVVLWYCSGNRDEEHWGNPYDFDILRKPNHHQGFGGGGPHYCLGAALARTMLKGMLTEVYTRIPDIEAGEPDCLVANFIHGIKRLPVEWTPEAR
jgi:cytochrome P450